MEQVERVAALAIDQARLVSQSEPVNGQRQSGLAASSWQWQEIVPWLLVASSPLIFASTTWMPSNSGNPVHRWLRDFGLPITAVESLVLWYSLRAGFQPFRSLIELPVWARAALAILIAVAFGNALFVAQNSLTAFLHACLWLIHFWFGLSVAWMITNTTNAVRSLFWPAVVMGLIFYVALVAAYVTAIPDPATFKWHLFRLGVTNIRHVGFYSTIGTAAALGLAASQKQMKTFLIWTVAAAVMLALSFWSGTRGSVVAVWASVFVGLIWFRSLRTPKAWAALMGSTILALGFSFVHTVPNKHFGLARIGSSVTRGGVDQVGSRRVSMWQSTWDAILQHPFFGHGQGQFRSTVPESLGTFNHPHNGVLQSLFDWGFVGATCFAALICLLIWRSLSGTQDPEYQRLPAFLVGASLLATSIYDGPLYYTYPLMMLGVAFAWMIGTTQSLKQVP